MLEILKEIEKHGFIAYYVGGYPRDKYLGISTNDFDICTNATPNELSQMFDCDMTFSKYGNVKVLFNNINYEITTFRKDSDYKDYRKPTIEFVNSLAEDLLRRDFTINTLCIDSSGNYIDILGSINDINDKIIKVVGNSDKKIEEDALRILRALRFASDLNFKLDNKLEQSIIKYKDNIKYLNEYKIEEEIKKVKNKDVFKKYLKEFEISIL